MNVAGCEYVESLGLMLVNVKCQQGKIAHSYKVKGNKTHCTGVKFSIQTNLKSWSLPIKSYSVNLSVIGDALPTSWY